MQWRRIHVCSYRAFVVVVVTMSVRLLFQSWTIRTRDEGSIHQDALSIIRLSNSKDHHVLTNNDHHTPEKVNLPTLSRPCFKQVQIWTHRCNSGNGSEITCPGLSCGVRQIEDTSLKTLEESDIVFFDPLSKWDWNEVHAHKQPGQVWVTGTGESPINTRKRIIPPQEYLNSTYDYIMTYRRHARTIYGDYGNFDTSKPSVDSAELRNWAEGKTKVAVWVAKNCRRNNVYLRWNRTEFVRAFSKLIQVDLYGPCGDEECPRLTKSCVEKIQAHKFYLALENCKCRNYITEKVWGNSFGNNLVPIVYGPPREDYELVLPPNSFIFIEDFNSLSDLTDYLTLLDKRDDLYNRYHEWRKLGTARFTLFHDCMLPEEMCRVVERMSQDENAKAAGTYKLSPPFDWDSWWQGSCHNVKDFPITMD